MHTLNFMPKETEMKVTYKDRKEVIRILKSMGAVHQGGYELCDIYYSKYGDISNTHELFRLRTKEGNTDLTFKGPSISQGKLVTRDEFTTQVSDPSAMAVILEHIGYHNVRENGSLREVFQLGDVQIIFIDLLKPSHLFFLEIEGPRAGVNTVLAKLGDQVSPVGEEIFHQFDKTN